MDNKEKKFISAVLYVHNAENHIAEFMKRLIALLENNFEHSEIVCVNDASTDKSVDQIKSVKNDAQETAITIVNLSHYHGLEIAMNAGDDISIGDFILEIDTTNQTWDDSVVMQVYRKVLEGNDIVSASPDKPEKMSSSIFYWTYRHFSDSNETMHSETFRILSRRAMNRINSMSRTIPYRKGIYLNCGLQTANIKYEVQNSELSSKNDKQLKKYRYDLAFETLILFTNAGEFVTKFMTTLMMIISTLMLVYTIVIYASAQPVAGWTTTILFLSVAFLGLFAILTIIVKYLQILVNLNFKRTKYTFESIEKLTRE